MDLSGVEAGSCRGWGAIDVVGLFSVEGANGESNYEKDTVSCLIYIDKMED